MSDHQLMSATPKGYVPNAPKCPLGGLTVFLLCVGVSIVRFRGRESDKAEGKGG